MNNFSQYVTRTAFQLSLSKNMIVALEMAKEFHDGKDYFTTRLARGENPFSHNNDFCTPIRSLMHRGLVEHHDLDKSQLEGLGYFEQERVRKAHRSYTLTEAGHHVYALCVLAGLIVVPEAKEKAA